MHRAGSESYIEQVFVGARETVGPRSHRCPRTLGAMSESEQPAEKLDPKEAMRQALERKKQAEHLSASQGVDVGRGQVHAHGKVGGKRQFRRKSGG